MLAHARSLHDVLHSPSIIRVRVTVGNIDDLHTNYSQTFYRYWYIMVCLCSFPHRIFSEDGILVATCQQESLIRPKL